ncbi:MULTISPECIES: hypothetical protein [unclassified Raoultella]|uniref:hypothetical protein n=1 Tax=unclassified Raoultella TaxID=2627600 RepID=UPI00135A2BAD|nr:MULTISPECIES: hypothetical protein [unclassified Raoultella]
MVYNIPLPATIILVLYGSALFIFNGQPQLVRHGRVIFIMPDDEYYFERELSLIERGAGGLSRR